MCPCRERRVIIYDWGCLFEDLGRWEDGEVKSWSLGNSEERWGKIGISLLTKGIDCFVQKLPILVKGLPMVVDKSFYREN